MSKKSTKKLMTPLDYHYSEPIDFFIKRIEKGDYSNQNISMAFFAKKNPITGLGEIYYKPSITNLDINYLKEMKEKFNFTMIISFGGGGIED